MLHFVNIRWGHGTRKGNNKESKKLRSKRTENGEKHLLDLEAPVQNVLLDQQIQ